MKRILCIISSLNAGGAETFLMKLARVLSIEDYQFDFVVSAGDGCYTDEVLEGGGKIYQVPPRKKDFLGAFNGIKKIVKDNEYDVVLKLAENSLSVFDLIAARLGGAHHLAVRSCNAPTDLSKKMRFVHAFFRPLLNFVSTVRLSPSQLAADFMFGQNKDVTLLHNGVDLNVFRFDLQARADVRRELNVEDGLLVGHIGRFHVQKNHIFLIEIFKKIQEENKNAYLVLVGTGGLENDIRAKIADMGLQNHVIFLGQRFDIPQLLSAMDVFVFPSLYEGMPNTVIEAQATGLPCVIADTITPEADITGLVNYLSLADTDDEWARVALSVANNPRKDTSSDLRSKGYDITSVANEFISLLGMNDTDL